MPLKTTIHRVVVEIGDAVRSVAVAGIEMDETASLDRCEFANGKIAVNAVGNCQHQMMTMETEEMRSLCNFHLETPKKKAQMRWKTKVFDSNILRLNAYIFSFLEMFLFFKNNYKFG